MSSQHHLTPVFSVVYMCTVHHSVTSHGLATHPPIPDVTMTMLYLGKIVCSCLCLLDLHPLSGLCHVMLP